MLALLSVWISLASLIVAVVMVLYRPAFNDALIPLVVMFGSPGALAMAGIVLWAYRKEPDDDPGIRAQRVQAKFAITLSLIAAAIVYLLVIFADRKPVV